MIREFTVEDRDIANVVNDGSTERAFFESYRDFPSLRDYMEPLPEPINSILVPGDIDSPND